MLKFIKQLFKPKEKVKRCLVMNQITEGVSLVCKVHLEHSDFNEISVLVEEIQNPDSILVQVSNNGKSWYTVGTDIRTKGWHEYPVLANWVRLYKLGSHANAKAYIVS